MELEGRTGKLLKASVVQLQGALSDRVDRALDIITEFLQVFSQKRGVNLLDGFFGWESHVECAVKRHQTRVDDVVAATWW